MKRVIKCAAAPKPKGVYSHAGQGAGLIFISGQLPLDPRTNEFVDGDIQVQTKQVMENIGAILSSAGLGFPDILKVTIYLANIEDLAVVNNIYAQYFPKDPPARAAVAVGQLPPDVLIEIEAIALV